MSEEEGVRRARYPLNGTAASITEARDHASAFFARSAPPLDPLLMDDVLVAVSELVTNAVRHAPGPCELELEDDGRKVAITVTDTHTELPVPRPADLSGNGGLGWHVLCAMAGGVQTRRLPAGKSVAVTLDRLREAVRGHQG